MLTIFKNLDPAQNPPLAVVNLGDYSPDYSVDPAALFDILQKRPATLMMFMDMSNDISSVLFPTLNQIYSSLSADSRMTFLVVLGKWNTDVTAATCLNYWYPVTGAQPPNCLAMSNGAWNNSLGAIFAAGFVNVPFAQGDTPFVYMITRNGVSPNFTYRIVDKFHMLSADTGDGGAVAPTDLLKFQFGSGAPSFGDLPPFIIRRMQDHVAGIGIATAQISGSHTALDLGDSIMISYSKKGIGTGAAPSSAANLSWKVGAAAKADVPGLNTTYGTGAGQIPLDSYEQYGESVKYSPKDSDLLPNAGQVLDLYLKDGGGGISAITDTEGVPMQGPSDPLKITSLPIGASALFVRANVGDEGIHAAPLYVSPDISIVHEAQAARSDASVQGQLATDTYVEPGNSIYSVPASGHQDRLFLRAFNKGTMKARNVQGVIYWAQPSTLIMPAAGNWNPVCNAGTAPYVFFNTDIPAPAGTPHSIAVSEDFDWNANLPPYDPAGGDTNHYCLVAMIAADNDPVYAGTANPIPTLAELAGKIATWDDYSAFVTLKNVAWKNIMTIQYIAGHYQIPPGGLDFRKHWPPFWIDTHHLKIPVRLPVPPRPAPHQLEVINRFPTTWNVNLVADKRMAEGKKAEFLHPMWKVGKNDVIIEKLKPMANRIPDLTFLEEERNGVLLDVTLPDFVQGGAFVMSVRQLYKGREIGRLTFIVQMPKFPGGKPVFDKEKASKK